MIETAPAAARTAAASLPPIARTVPAAALDNRQARTAVSSSGVTVKCSDPMSTATPCPASQAIPAAATTVDTSPTRPAIHHARITSTRIGVQTTVAHHRTVATAEASRVRGRRGAAGRFAGPTATVSRCAAAGDGFARSFTPTSLSQDGAARRQQRWAVGGSESSPRARRMRG